MDYYKIREREREREREIKKRNALGLFRGGSFTHKKKLIIIIITLFLRFALAPASNRQRTHS